MLHRSLARLALIVLRRAAPVAAERGSASQPAATFTLYLPVVRGSGQRTTLMPTLPGAPLPPVQIACDETRAAHASIGSEGGSLSAVGTDGTGYVLASPADALDFTATITVTPAGDDRARY